MASDGHIRRSLELLERATTLLETIRGPQQNSVTPASTCTSAITTSPSSNVSGESSRSGTPSSSLLSEMRRNFSPYPALEGRIAGRPTLRRRAAVPASTRTREKVMRFYCLPGSSDSITPSNWQKSIHQRQGIGESMLTIRNTLSQDEFHSIIRATYPLLQNTEFKLFKASGGGGAGKPLIILPPQGNPSASSLIGTPNTLIYIVPSTNIVLENDGEGQDLGSDESQGDIVLGGENSSSGCVVGDGLIFERSPAPGCSSAVSSAASSRLSRSARCVAGPSSSLSEQNDRTFDDCVTMEDMREVLYEDNPGIQPIAVSRDEFLTQVLNTYKDPNLCLYKKPTIHFFGEAGRDVGALSREYFWKALIAMANEKVDGCRLFEGADDHLLPSTNAFAMRSGMFRTVGKLMAHSAIHTGIAFIGLAKPVWEYLLKETVDGDTSFNMEISDASDFEVQECLRMVGLWKDGNIPDAESHEKICAVALESGFSGVVTKAVLPHLHEHILYNNVIDRRRAQLDEIRQSFNSTLLPNFLRQRQYLTDVIFPTISSFEYPANFILDKMVCHDSSGQYILNWFKEAARSLIEAGKGANMLCALTGSGVLPENDIKIEIVDVGPFLLKTCFNTVDIPRSFTREDVERHLRMAVEYASSGFGSG